MSRPQATTAFIPVSNRASTHRPSAASAFMAPEEAAKVTTWYDITSKKKADKVTAEVMIFGEIGWEVTARQFVKDLTLLEADVVNVHINSVGGDVFDGVAIYNALRQKDAEVFVFVDGLAASAASFIAQAGDEVIMLRGSQMMIHDASAFAWGNEQVMLETAQVLGRISNSIADIYAQRAGGTVDEWREIMKTEMWYSPEEAVTAGLADRVLADENEDAQAAKNGWDLRVFNYAGRSEAPDPIEETRKIINRVQEALVTPKDQNTTEGQSTTPPPTPEAPAPQEAPSTEPVGVPDPAADEEVPVTPTSENPAPVVPQVENSARVTFMVGGVQTSDPQAVQNHITMLETFQSETRTAHREAFINSLASGPSPKIAATQIDSMKKLVETMNDTQYDLWVASWDAAPPAALFASHGDVDGGSPTGTAQSAATDRVEVLTAIVRQHKMGGMLVENIKNTNSYKELLTLQPDFTL